MTVLNIDYIVESVEVISSTNSDFLELNRMILNHSINSKIDYEDCMQLYLANKYNIDNISTTDKSFCEGLVKLFEIDIL